MEAVRLPEDSPDRRVRVVGAQLVESYTVYIMEVTDGEHSWMVKHRYSDFHELHEKLTAEKKVDRRHLPPKKILGKNSKSLVERRQKELEVYLQTLLLQFPQATPKPLTCFLDFHLYEINGVTAALAEELFHKGEQLLQAGQVFSLCPLQLFSISQKLRLAKPTCCNGDAKTDLGHILDFTCRLRYLRVTHTSVYLLLVCAVVSPAQVLNVPTGFVSAGQICGTRGPLGTSNIQESSLLFDLSVFKSLLQIEISECSSQQIEGLSSLRSSLATLSVHSTTDTMMSILVPEAKEFPQWEAEGLAPECPVTAVIPVWRSLTTLDMSHNGISSIDSSVKLIPKVEFLDLSYNHLSTVENLQYLYNLVHVDLSYNNLKVLEAAHTRLGNIKTLSLAGNQLEELSGLTKLYSLVNLDLSHNHLAQLEEIRNISALPCLEKLSLSRNPMSIVPDYRTRVLAQFGDRAAEVCLDAQVTTEKELDTVEVLKAIQKAKQVKDQMSGSDKKISEETTLSAAPPPLSSSSSSSSRCSSAAPPAAISSSSLSSSSCPAQLAACPSQEAMSRDAAPVPPGLCPVVVPPPPASFNTHADLLSPDPTQVQQAVISLSECTHCGASTSITTITPAVTVCPAWCQLLPSHPLLRSFFNKEFNARLSLHLSSTLKEQKKKTNKEKSEDVQRLPSKEVQSHLNVTEVGHSSLGSKDGYFEMGLDESEESVSSSLPVPAEGPCDQPEESYEEEEEEVQVSRVLWCYCLRVMEEVQPMEACLVLTDRMFGLLHPSHDFTWTNHDGENQRPPVEEVLSSLQVELLVPFSHLRLPPHTELPHTCLAFGLRAGLTRWYVFSEAEQLQPIRAQMVVGPQIDPQPLPRSLLSSWELEESQGAQGGYPAYLLPPDPSSAPHSPSILSDMLKTEDPALPRLLFLTQRHLWVLTVPFRELVQNERGNPDCQLPPSSRLVRVPLGSVVLHPSEGASQGEERTSNPFCGDSHHQTWRSHSLQLLLGGQKLLLLFPLRQDRGSFLGGLTQQRAALEGLKMVALPIPPQGQQTQGVHRPRARCCPPSSWDSSHQVEENCPPPHLIPGLSPGLKLLSGIRGPQLLTYFHRFIAMAEGEELRQVLWTSVVLYSSPEAELTCCLLLSTNAIYFLLEDSASRFAHHTVLDVVHSGDPDVRLCCCLSIRLSDVLSVNVGLFDQYFRVVGRSADHIVSCLSRDSYGTGLFLQELMSVLSLQQQLPPPELSDQDFYSQFTNTHTGKMQNYELVHSSRVKFIYPNEEEMGDLTFIVAERMALSSAASASASASASSSCFNVLLYLLVFQVQTPTSLTSQPLSGPSPPPLPQLQPRTLVLTSTDVFLLDEDYISYPLPDFAKEPPPRERYQLREARRIRDLDRVLLGYQTYPQALTLVFDDLPGPDLLCHLTMDHFAAPEELPLPKGIRASRGAEGEVQWCIFVPGADSRERLISLLARQWEALCSRELPVELTG
ncbi:nischarin isoform X2 [Antennarius striatus]|uniref:nischarin isoform X2 n=1 Tax=Antennarius striatus TaxID=241820 RepID=UPI0035B49349